jgi:hypothetical protein
MMPTGMTPEQVLEFLKQFPVAITTPAEGPAPTWPQILPERLSPEMVALVTPTQAAAQAAGLTPVSETGTAEQVATERGTMSAKEWSAHLAEKGQYWG